MIKKCTLLILLFLGLTVQRVYSAPQDFLISTYRIEISVECLDTTLPRFLTMQGIALQSEFNIRTGRGRIEQLVNNHELNATLTTLRGLGNVTATSSSTRNEFAQFHALQSELRIRNEEYRNLNELLLQAQTLADFRIVEGRLVNLIAEIERLRGRINFLNSEIGTTRIHISIATIPPEPEEPDPTPEPEPEPEPEPPGTFARIGNAFLLSAGATLSVVQGLVLFLAYASIPLAVMLAIGAVVWRIVKRKPKGGDKNEENS
ncbi:MAG: DUF4349 domain-containing protein [Defluviitaleaceae bacterium]|nr:DUF4349 domain-containing protein [Defluviitaleaceae bacterium]